MRQLNNIKAKNHRLLLICVFFALLIFSRLNLYAQTSIRIVGSSLLYSHINLATEFFDALQRIKNKSSKESQFINITTESTGSGGGIKIFCDKSKRDDQPMAVVSTRAMTGKEFSRCRKNGINIKESKLGCGAIALVTLGGDIDNLSLEDIFTATSKYILIDGKWVKNKYIFWSQVNPNLPNLPIKIIGPSFSSGAMHSFLKKVHAMYYNKLDTPTQHRGIREEGIYMQAGDSEAVVVAKLEQRKNSPKDSYIAIIDFGYYLMNKQRLNLIKVNNINPSILTIKSREYPLVRDFYIYSKTGYKKSKYLKQFMMFIQSQPMHKVLQNYGVISIYQPHR